MRSNVQISGINYVRSIDMIMYRTSALLEMCLIDSMALKGNFGVYDMRDTTSHDYYNRF